jgi:hypothetical protein
MVLTVVVFLIAAAAAAWWLWPSRGEPTISFMGFRQENGSRVALFSLRNPGNRTYEYDNYLLVKRPDNSGAAWLPYVATSLLGIPGGSTDTLSPQTGAIMTVLLPEAFRDAGWTGQPLRFGLRCTEQPRERLAFLPGWLRAWFPKSMLAPAPGQVASEPKIIWSEVVMP